MECEKRSARGAKKNGRLLQEKRVKIAVIIPAFDEEAGINSSVAGGLMAMENGGGVWTG